MWNLESFAKINIFLEITGKQNGLHTLHSLFVKINLADNITIIPSHNLTVTYKNKQIDGDIITKAMGVLKKRFPQINTNFTIDVVKNIPIGAGLGGGSSNAGTIINFIIEQNSIIITNKELGQIAMEVGSDVPFFLHNHPMILRGTGAELTKPLFKIPQLHCVIAHPEKHLLTKNVFGEIAPPHSRFRAVLNFEDALSRINEMQTAANLLTNGGINTTLNTLFHPRALVVRMSGSGSACFALFKNEADAKECFAKAKNVVKQCYLTQTVKF
jgi:4-diphosphocytidyl-2-C-methyl-D-erythritol kinase